MLTIPADRTEKRTIHNKRRVGQKPGISTAIYTPKGLFTNARNLLESSSGDHPGAHNMDTTSILISHAANERPLAEAWKDLICGTFSGIDQASVFFSSELGAFSGQETFVAQIFTKMREATSILSLQTPSSSGRPWIIFEGGMAWADKGKSLYPIIFESRDVEKNESIFGKLENPMNALQQ